jgi:hypothetical protein
MNKLYVLAIGVVNIPTGKTMYDWSIYDHPAGHTPTVSLTNQNSLLYGGGGEIGEEVELRGNDSQRLLGKHKIVDNCKCTKEELMAMLKKHGYDYYPLRPFAARAKSNRKLKTSYSVK